MDHPCNGRPCDQYAFVFKALSDSTRLHICSLLSEKEVCGCDLLRQVHITQPTLSYHMKLLCEAGVAKSRKDGAWMRYSINGECMEELEGFLHSLRTSGG